MDRKSSSNSLGGGSTPALTRHSSAYSHGPSSSAASPPGLVRVRSRTATRFEAFKKDVLSSRLAKYRAIATMPHLRVDNDVVTEVIDPALPNDAQLKFVDMANNDTKLVVVTTTHLLVFAYKNSRPRSVSTVQMEHAGANAATIVPSDFSLKMSFQVSEITTLYDSTIDDRSVFVKTVKPVRMSQGDMEARLFVFSQPSQRDAFEAHLLSLLNSELLDHAAARGDVTSSSPIGTGVNLIVWDSVLKVGEDVRRNLNNDAKGTTDVGQTDADDAQRGALETCETDFLYVANSREAMCAKMRAYGETKILYSSEVALADNTHDVVVVCDKAIYLGKKRKEHKVRHRVSYDAIEGIVIDSKSPQLVVHLDCTKVTLRSDITMTFPSLRYRDIFVTVVSSAYEASVVDRLSTAVKENVFWEKRGFVESQLNRLVSNIKAKHFLKGEADEKVDGLTSQELRAAKWLLYTLRYDTAAMIVALSSSGIPSAQLDFIARCVYSVFSDCGWEEMLLRRCVEHSLALRDGDANASAAPMFSEPGSFSGSVLHHYVAQCGEQYVQVVLAQLIERFIEDPMSNVPMQFAAAMEDWLSRFMGSVLENSDGDILADELKILIALIHERSFAAARQAPSNRVRAQTASPDGISRLQNSVDQESLRSIGMFFFSKLIFPALTDPLGTGVLTVEPTSTQIDNLTRIAAVLEGVFSARPDALLERRHASLNGMGELDKRDLVKWATSHVDGVRDCLKSFIFSDMVSADGTDGPDGAEAAVPRFVSTEANAAPAVTARRLTLHIERNVSLAEHNPKLLHALCKTMAPYYTAVLCHVSRQSRPIDTTTECLPSMKQHTAVDSSDKVKPSETDVAAREAAVRAEMDTTVRQLTHEVLDLRRQLELARAEASRTTTLSLRLQEELALIHTATASSPKKSGRGTGNDGGRVVTFSKLPKDKVAPHDSDTSDSDASTDDSDAGETVPSSPMRLRRSASGVVAVNPLPITQPKNGLSPAMQEYHRSLMEVSSPAAIQAVPMKSRVFGCPLDTYVIGRGALQSKDVDEL